MIRAFFLALLLAAAPLAQAHKASDAYLTLRVDGSTVDARIDIALRDLDRDLDLDTDADDRLTWKEVHTRWADIAALAHKDIKLRADEVLSWQRMRLEKVDSFRGLYQWRDAMVQRCAMRRGLWGCELGSLAGELSDTDDKARLSLSEHFAQWRQLFSDALERMRDNGVLRPDIDARGLATGLLAAVEGGLLLSQTARDPRLMQAALNHAIDHIASFRT